MSNALTLTDWQKFKDIDQTTYESRKYGITKGELAVKCGIAHELGLPPILAGLKGIQIINNVPTIAPKLAWALILRHPDFDGYEEVELKDDKGNFLGYEITLRRKNNPVKEATRRFTLEDAKRITQGNKKLIEKENYMNYPKNMCYWRAMGFCQDIVFADVTFGIPRADEMGASITPDGDVIEGSWSVSTTPSSLPLKMKNEISLDQLIAQYGAEKVMVKNNGVVPDMNDLSLLRQIKDELEKEQEKEEKEND